MAEASDIAINSRIALPRRLMTFRYARSRGPGGQNVNKLNTKATLCITLHDLAEHLPADAMARLKQQASAHISEAGLQISCESSRSQVANRDECIERLIALIRRALIRPKKRRPTRPTRGSVEKRLQSKKHRSDVKKQRRERHD